MSDRPSNGGRRAGSPADTDEVTVDADVRPPDAAPEIDDEIQRRLRAAYLNDAERELIVTGVESADEAVVVTFRTPHGDATHTERFPAPRHGSLAESASLMAFLETAGVSPLDLDDLVGARVPATYEDGGWQLNASYSSDAAGSIETGDGADSGQRSIRARSKAWLWAYRYWLFAAFFIGGELLFVAVIILLYG